jgi:membrane-bound inhibitor of C-type lysozyme
MYFHRFALFLVLLAAAATIGCTRAPRADLEVTERRVRFTCVNGEEIEMRFFPREGVAVLVRHGRPIELQQQRSGSGFLYSNGPNTVRSKGNELTLEIGRMAPIACKAA